MPSLPKKLPQAVPVGRITNPLAKTTTERGYGWKWQKLRAAWLKEEPRLCVDCEREGFLVPATQVDHVIPHRGEERLLYDRGNLQGLCEMHHARKSAGERKQRAR